VIKGQRGSNRRSEGGLGIALGTKFSYSIFGGDAEEAEALVCKTSLSGFESHRYLQFLDAILRSTLMISQGLMGPSILCTNPKTS
jgi:hypothetical protein